MIRPVYRLIRSRESWMKAVFLLSSIFAVAALCVIFLFLMMRGIPAMAEIGFFRFLFGTEWSISDPQNQSFGILPMLVGSIYVTALATLFGVTAGLFTAIFLYKFCPKKIAGIVHQLVNLLAGIPSVVFGLFGIMVIVPFLRNHISPTGIGHGVLAAAIVLSIMVLPIVVSISLDALTAVPESNYEGALALGATKERAVFSVMVPAAKSGIMAGAVLAVGRAIGETMAVIMVIGGSPEMPTGSLFQSVRTLTANIALGAMDSSGLVLEAMIATGVILFALALLINIGFNFLKNKDNTKKKRGRKRNRNRQGEEKKEFHE